MKKKKYEPLVDSPYIDFNFIDSVPNRNPKYPISSFRFKNLKSWKDSKELNFKKINLVYGKNSSGKSSLLQSILVTNHHLHDLVYGSERFAEFDTNIENIRFVSNTYDLGSFNHSINASRKKNESNGITFLFSKKMEGSGEITLSFTYKDDQGSGALDSFYIKFSEVRLTEEVDYRMRMHRRVSRRQARAGRARKQNKFILNGQIKAKIISKRVSKDILGLEKKGYKLDLSRFSCELDEKSSRPNSAFRKYSIPEYDFIIYHDLYREGVITAKNKAKTAEKYTSGMLYGPSSLKMKVDQNLDVLSNIIRTSLSVKPHGSVIHIPPIRGIPPRNSDLTTLTDADPSVAYIYRSFTQSRFRFTRGRNRKNELQESVNEKLKRLGSNYSVELMSGEQETLGSTYTNIILKEKNKRLTLLDVGRGISQILPIIVASSAERKETILVEQPEVHIHPKLQADLADLFIESPNQWIIESHSENIILRIQRRIREGRINHEEVKLFYIVDGKQGAEFLEIDFLADGNLSRNFPKGFFDVGLEELLS